MFLIFDVESDPTLIAAVALGLWQYKVHIKADEHVYSILSSVISSHNSHLFQYLELANPIDFETEFNDLIIAMKMSYSMTSAIEEINTLGSHHTDCIITSSKLKADAFTSLVDSAGVYWNASTRFADGYRYGFGAEIGVSTSKIHARGPVGIDGLLSYKYKLVGHGHKVSDYMKGQKSYRHLPL